MRLVVRRQGALIRELVVQGIPILTGAIGEWLEGWKVNGTITVCPAGPSRRKPQHGDSRLTDYVRAFGVRRALELRAFLPLRQLGHVKSFNLMENGLEVIDEIVNLGKGTRRLSLGEHFYLWLSGVDALQGVRWLNLDGTDKVFTGVLANGTAVSDSTLADFEPALLRGETIFTDDFTGRVILFIPGVGWVSIEAKAYRDGMRMPVALWWWHREETNTLCCEPVAGIGFRRGRQRHDLITLRPGQTLRLVCRVALIRPRNIR